MALPPSCGLWVGMLLLLLQFPAAMQMCIFDEVQAQVRVVRAPPSHPDSPPNEPTGRQRLLTSRQKPSRPGRSVKQGSVLEAPPTPQPIRIHTWLSGDGNSLSEAEKGRMEAAVEEAVRVVSSLLSVNRVQGALLLSRDINKYCRFLWRNSSTLNYNRCGRANSHYRAERCLDVTIPDDHLAGCHIYPDPDSPHRTVLRPDGAGLPDTDFLLYLHVQSTDKCRAETNVLAYAVHCQTDMQGRPVAGVVVVCRDRLTAAVYSHQSTVQAVIHELFHALGFSKVLFSTWRDCSSSSAAGAGCSPRGRVTHTDASGQMRIFTPSVISALQEHLVSSDPELGGPLENLDVSVGKVSSHWESRVLQGSIMTAVLGDPTTVRIDIVTLAALQDTGWYAVNLSRAQSLVWGAGEGGSFGSTLTCKDNSSSFFCTGSGPGCHFLHLHKGECQTDQYLDGCRIYKPLKNGSECWIKENIRMSAEAEQSGELYASDSRCFLSTLIRQNQSDRVSSSVEPRCYRHRCTGLNSYQIQLSGSEWVDCPAGGTTQVKGYQGSVFCPHSRLCLYSDVTPLLDHTEPLPACITCGTHSGTWSPLRPLPVLSVAAVLCFTAAVCLLGVLTVLYRKCQPSRDSTVFPEDHNEL